MYHIYSKPNCSFCDKAKNLLRQKGIPFTESVIGRDVMAEEVMALFPFVRTVPIIIKTGARSEFVGGFSELQEELLYNNILLSE